MNFEGVTEDFGRETISGWASDLDRGKRAFPDVRLYFRTPGSFAPGSSIDRENERTGFVFRLPPEFRDIGWALIKGGFYRTSAWSRYDSENSLAEYQREGEIVERFRANSAVAADLRGATFDQDASHTVVPGRMRTAIAF